ncbi:hypothetical protein [Bacillus sp. B-jedd]|uniref:hypothetical protein n=1 Tax=Bacillus sp. B-jedd TaxID=1476857 RepID=UPI0006626834|nr:hypothetical protein [Bacillus sp. B-jedd]
MFSKKRTLLLFLFACAVHAIAFFYFFSIGISNALDGSHRKSYLDWLPFAVFLASFLLQGLPGLRASWKAWPIRMLVSLVFAVSAFVWLIALLFRVIGFSL